MPIPTSRTKEKAEIRIKKEVCTGCGLCVSVCKDFSIEIINKKVAKTASPLYGCIGCGHCMAICPTGAIEIYGREISPAVLFDIPKKESLASYEQLLSVYQHRRSIREFKDKPIEDELIEKILTAAKTAPMGLPPSDVNVMILNGVDKTRQFAEDFSQHFRSYKFMTSNFFTTIMRPVWGTENSELFKGFIKPLFKAYAEGWDEGKNNINYDAPLAMYFYATPYADPADPIVAATYAMIIAETLGLGTVMLGAVHPFIQRGKKSKKFREKYGIKHKSKEGIFVAFGYPKVKYKKAIKRTFASINRI